MNEKQIDAIRAFNRFYTPVIGLLDKNYLNTEFSLTEARILYELFHHPDGITASDLIVQLHLDKGYLSRILQQFERRNLIKKKASKTDKRSFTLSLTDSGRAVFEKLNAASSEQLTGLLSTKSDEQVNQLAANMVQIQNILKNAVPTETAMRIKLEDITIRTELKPGDMGYIIYMHGHLYNQEYGYGLSFESYVVSAFAEYYKNYNSQLDRVWIAEHDTKIVGFLSLMNRGYNTAQLRFFILHPKYRGIGLGRKMMTLYMQFFKEVGYKHCYLWTTNEQLEAANMYSKLGFKLTEEMDSVAFGKRLTEQRYDLFIAD